MRSDPNQFSRREGETLVYLQCYYAQRGYSPTIREISVHLGLQGASFAVAAPGTGALARLAEMGWISEPDMRTARGYRPVILGWATVRGREVPVYPVVLLSNACDPLLPSQ